MKTKNSIHIHGKLWTGTTPKQKRKIKEMAGLELLMQKGIMIDAVQIRLKQLARSFK